MWSIPFADVAVEKGGGVVYAAVGAASGGQVQPPRLTPALFLIVLPSNSYTQSVIRKTPLSMNFFADFLPICYFADFSHCL